MKNSEIKKLSSLKCVQNSKSLSLVAFVYLLIIGLFAAIQYTLGLKYKSVSVCCSIGSLLVSGSLFYGLLYVIKSNFEKQKVEFDDLFQGFKCYKKTFCLTLLQCIYIFLWSLLLVIPGIIKMISYSMSYFILLDNQSLSSSECIVRSKNIMNGHKWEYFCLILSYLGWIILIILTLGILSIWVIPKIQTSSYIFYKQLNNN